MKKYKNMMLLLTLLYVQNSYAQTKIGDLYYELSGTTASVAINPSGYNNQEYVIPDIVEYNNLSFVVTELSPSAFRGSKAKKIKMPNTITTINMWVFRDCSNLNSLIIPPSVTMIGLPGSSGNSYYSVFDGSNLLRELIYLPHKAPILWEAINNTYVPDKQSYSSPVYSREGAKIIEMITFEKTEFEYTGKSPSTTWINNVGGYTASLSLSSISGEVGSHEEWIPVTFTKDGESFKADVVYRYTIKPAKLTAKASNASRVYGDNNPQFNISYSGFVGGDNESVLTTQPTISTIATKTSNVGEYPITISGGSAANYELVYEPGVLTITKAPLSAKVNDVTRQYGMGNPSFSVNYIGLKNDELKPQWLSSLQFTTEATEKSDVGEYSISATGNPLNYDLLSISKGTLTVTQAPLTIKASDATRRYYDSDPLFEYTCIGFVNNDDKQSISTQPKIVTEAKQTSDVGSYPIIPSGALAKNYIISYNQGTLKVTKRPLIATSNCTREYGEENPVFAITYDGFVNNENDNVIAVSPTATTEATKTSKVGEYPITVNGGNATNYEISCVPGVLTVTKAPLSGKVEDAIRAYGSQNPTFAIEYYGLKNNETIPTWSTTPTFLTDATKSSGIGQYEVKAINGVPVNYDLGDISVGTLTITPAPLTIKAKNATRQYYSDDPNLGYTCNGFVNGENENVLSPKPALTTTANKSSNVGTYPIRVSGASNSNYSISYTDGTLTITPRTLYASVGNYERVYNEDNPAFEVKYNGFVGDENESVLLAKATASTQATKTSDVGTYKIEVAGGGADNYKLSYISGLLTINKAEQTILWEQDLSNLKVGDQVELEAVASSGLPITYLIDSSSLAEIYSASNNKQYLDCTAKGQFTLRAVQDGNKNYYSSTRVSKAVTIGNGESAVKSVEISFAKIQRMPFGIRISNAMPGDFIRIYSADGVLQKSVKAEDEITDIILPNRNVYVVKVGARTMKVGL